MTEQQKPLTKAQVVAALAEELQMKKTEIGGFFDALTDLAYKETKKKGAFVLPGFGKLIKDKRKARTGRNPATGAEIKIPAKTVVKFRLQKACKDAIVPAK
jgi:DNA-binding protein HU-beta